MNIFFGHGMRAFWILVVENKAFTAGKICAISDVFHFFFWKIGQHWGTLLTMLTRRFYHKGSSVNWEVFEDSSYASLDIRTTLADCSTILISPVWYFLSAQPSRFLCYCFLTLMMTPRHWRWLFPPDLQIASEALTHLQGFITHNDFLCTNFSLLINGAQKLNKYHVK